VAATEGRHESGRVRLPAQRQPGQLQARRPPLGARRQRGDVRIGQGGARPFRRLLQQRRGLVRGEP
jgi:hypothetical protein